jgi:hypothetical protein
MCEAQLGITTTGGDLDGRMEAVKVEATKQGKDYLRVVFRALYGPTPEWLVRTCESRLEVTGGSGDWRPRLLAVKTEAERQGMSFLDMVNGALPEGGLLPKGSYEPAFAVNPTLVGLGALIMSSARGSVSDVITANFDDLLEWHLELHGFRTQPVIDFPRVLRGDVDVRIHHNHGFLPLSISTGRRGTKWLVLTRKEFLDRATNTADGPWNTLVQSLLLSKTALFIGTSLKDLDMELALNAVNQHIRGTRTLGLVVRDTIEKSERDRLHGLGLAGLELGAYDALPDFLLAICRNAAAGPSTSPWKAGRF